MGRLHLSHLTTSIQRSLLLPLLLLACSKQAPLSPTHAQQTPPISLHYNIFLLQDGFSLQTNDDEPCQQLHFGDSPEEIIATLGLPQNQLGFHDDLLWSYPQWALLLWLEAPSNRLTGVILSAHPADNPHQVKATVHFYHEAITKSQGIIDFDQDLYQAQAIGKTYGYYRISQATFRSHENYLLIDHLRPNQHYVSLIAYSQRNPEAYLRRYYPSDRLHALPY